jgi:F-type H+-transporting ATPase subunit b
MEQAERILATARADASAAADQAKLDLKESVARRMAAAEERILTAQASAEKEVRDAAIKVAIAAASEVISNQLSATDANKLIDLGISEIENKLH